MPALAMSGLNRTPGLCCVARVATDFALGRKAGVLGKLVMPMPDVTLPCICLIRPEQLRSCSRKGNRL